MKPKDQGTRWESEIVKKAEKHGIYATRLPEGGQYDKGDIELGQFVIEAKDRANLPIHEAVQKARRKAPPESLSAVVWKRKKRQPGNQKRTQVAKPIVCMDLDDFFDLVMIVEGI